eukprot:SAG22_NODE_12052_length_457_cov_0.935933_1_plen_31_part_01
MAYLRAAAAACLAVGLLASEAAGSAVVELTD